MRDLFLGHWVPACLPSFSCSSQLQHFKQLFISAWWFAQISGLLLLLLLLSNHLQSLQTPSRASQLHISSGAAEQHLHFIGNIAIKWSCVVRDSLSAVQGVQELQWWNVQKTARIVQTFVILLLWCSPSGSYIQFTWCCLPTQEPSGDPYPKSS